MRRISIIISLILLTCQIQAQWSNQNIVPEGNNLWSTFFIDDNTGWIVGSDGLILNTSNSGNNWNRQNSGTTGTLKSVQFINQSTGWICGENGLILVTGNGGNNWTEVSSGTSENLNDIHFADNNTGYIVGNNETILKSIDGGLSWIILQTGFSYDLYSIDFLDSLSGYAVGGRDSSNFLKTTDGGISWIRKTLTLNYSSTPMLNCVEFIDLNNGWIGSEGQYLNHSGYINRTTDGGETWSSLLLTRPSTSNDPELHTEEDNSFDNQRGIRSIHFKDLMHGFAVGGSRDGWWRSIYTTSDGGGSWQKKYGYPEQTGLLSVAITNSGKCYAVGYKGVIYRSIDYGISWSQILSGTQSGYTGDWISSVFMINDSIGWSAGFRKGIWYYPIIMKTTNGGMIWETNKEFGNTFDRTTTNVFFIDENTGWVTFYDKGSYKTTDGGYTWVLSTNPGNEKYFKNQDTGWSVYSPLGVFKSTDGGNLWTQKSNIPSNSIFFSDFNNGWAVGQSGSIIKSTDGGEYWTEKLSGVTEDLNDVHFFNDYQGICVGGNGKALITMDGGENWSVLNTGNSSTFNSVTFTNSTTIWISGTGGTILNSTDMGNSWTSFNGLTYNNLVSMSFINENNGWFAGWNGTILKYENFILPVELTSFEAKVFNEKVFITWQTASEVNNYGFEVERKTEMTDWVTIGFISGQGNSTSDKFYTYIDNVADRGTKTMYRLKQLDLNGSFQYSSIVEVDFMPGQFQLSQNFPNPFNPITTIKFQISVESKVILRVFNILGEQVAELLNEFKKEGIHQVDFSAQNLASGTYIYSLSVNGFTLNRKMILTK